MPALIIVGAICFLAGFLIGFAGPILRQQRRHVKVLQALDQLQVTKERIAAMRDTLAKRAVSPHPHLYGLVGLSRPDHRIVGPQKEK